MRLPALNRALKIAIKTALLGVLVQVQPASAQDREEMLRLSMKSTSSLERKCQRDKAPECAAYAMQYIEREGTATDVSKARAYSKRSCELNYARGCTIYGALVSEGAGHDPEVAEYFYSACALGDVQGCNLAIAYAYGRDHSLKGRDRRIEVARKSCQIGRAAGCDLLDDLGAKDQLITDPMQMNRAELQWYVGNTLDYVGAARSIVARHPDGTGPFGRPHPDSEYLGELIVNMGLSEFRKLDDQFVKTVARKQFWRDNREASRIAGGEWLRRTQITRAAKAREDAERNAWRRASSAASSSGSSSSGSTYTRPASMRQSAKVCYWVTNAGIGGGRYRKCD